MKNRDGQALEYMVKYCTRIEESTQRFGHSLEQFFDDEDYQQTIAFSLIQIGELVNRLSREFVAENNEVIPWDKIASIRNRLESGYYVMEQEIIWDIVINEIPALHNFCVDILKKNQSQ
jgi:uncharacterized protein with HEPN domain